MTETDRRFLSPPAPPPRQIRVADATTRLYSFTEPLGTAGDSATYAITTDGTDGPLAVANVLAFQFSVTLSGVTRTFGSATGAVFTQDNDDDFTATPEALFYNFSSTYAGGSGFGGYASFAVLAPGTLEATDQFCFQSMSGCYYQASSGPVGFHYPPFTLSATPLDGNDVVAVRSLSGGEPAELPEPATWSLLPLGLAGLWTARRLSRRRPAAAGCGDHPAPAKAGAA